MLTEVRDCDLLIVVTSSTFLKRKDMLKEKAVSPDHTVGALPVLPFRTQHLEANPSFEYFYCAKRTILVLQNQRLKLLTLYK